MITTLRRRSGRMTLMVVVLITVAGLTACEPKPDEPVRYEDVPMAAHRVNGVGWSTLINGDTIYLGGTFTQVRDQGGSVVASKTNLAAFDKNTGLVKPGFTANADGNVLAMATDGTTLYIGGEFGRVNGVARTRLAAIDLATGAVRPDWRADAANSVYSITVAAGRVFVAGGFTSVGGVARNRVVALSAADGSVDPTFNPNVNASVRSIAARADGSVVYIGGNYTSVGGTSTTDLTALSGTTGAVVAPTFNPSGEAIDLEISSDGTRLVAALADYANQGAMFSTSTGNRLNRQRCGGDAQAVTIVGANYFTGFHEECESDFSIRLTTNRSSDGLRDLSWTPSFDRFWGVRGLDGDGSVLAVAGDFTNVAGVPAQGLVIFKRQPPEPPPPPGPVQLPMGSTWRYLDTGVEAAGWTQPGFDDSAWSSGAAELGYGDGDEATVVGYGPSASSKYVTTWFRTKFNSAAAPATVTLDLIADDGAIVYLNGVELLRDNVSPGPDSATLRAATGRSGNAEFSSQSFVVPPELILIGTNQLAVSVHQDLPSSSDVSFDLGLRSTA